MTIKTVAYGYDKKGKLAAFNIEATSYEDAINDVKAELGAPRAMCLVLNKPTASEEPVPNEEAVA